MYERVASSFAILSLTLVPSGEDISTMRRHLFGLWGLGMMPSGLMCRPGIALPGRGPQTLASLDSLSR